MNKALHLLFVASLSSALGCASSDTTDDAPSEEAEGALAEGAVDATIVDLANAERDTNGTLGRGRTTFKLKVRSSTAVRVILNGRDFDRVRYTYRGNTRPAPQVVWFNPQVASTSDGVDVTVTYDNSRSSRDDVFWTVQTIAVPSEAFCIVGETCAGPGSRCEPIRGEVTAEPAGRRAVGHCSTTSK